MTDIPQKELRGNRGSNILNYIKKFSATEKVVFGFFAFIAFVSVIIMAETVNNHFSTEVPTYGGSLREGVVGLPRNINPVLAVTDIDRDLSSLVYSGLMKYVDGKITLDIAKSYTISNDGLTYIFKLKPRVYFQNGTLLTTEDIAFTIQKIQDPAIKSPRRVDWTDVTVKVISPTEIQFILKRPYSPFLANTTIGIIPKHIWSSVNDEQFIFSLYNIEPIGSGMYSVSSISRDNGGIPTQYKLESWNGYYNGYYGNEPFIPTIIFNFFPDESELLNALDQGTIDSAVSISPGSAMRLSTDKAQAYTILSSPLPRVFGVFFNQNQSPVLADKVVRQALDMSINRENLINTILKGYGIPITGPTPFIQPISTPAKTPTTGSTTKSLNSPTMINNAQSLLEKNGWKKDSNGVYAKKASKTSATVTLSFDIYTVDSPDLKQASELVKDAWNTLGANVTVKVYEPSDLYQNIIRTRKYDALLFGEVVGKDRDLYAFWHSSQLKSPGLNVALYANSKTDKLLEDIRTTNDETVRATKYAQFDQLVRADIPAIFLYMPNFIYAVPKAIKGIKLSSMNVPADRLNNISQWYTETERVWNIFTEK